MDRTIRLVAGLLSWAIRLLPPQRQDWGAAVWAEAGEVPGRWARLRWLAGGLWLVAREAEVIRRIVHTAAAVGAGAALVWLDWHPGTENVAAPMNRAGTIAVVALLAVLPWASRRFLGPVADNRAARAVRTGGYLAMYALLGVIVGLSRFAGSRFDHMVAFDQANHDAEMRSGAVIGAIVILALIGGYALVILAVTSRRFAADPATLAAGSGLGVVAALVVYALMPLGNLLRPSPGWPSAAYLAVLILLPLGLVLAAGPLATRSTRGSATFTAAARRGTLAGLCAGTAAALVVAILTITTMLMLPRQVDLIWANPSPNVPHGTLFEVQMSVSDTAAKYEAGLIAGPLLGLLIGAFGGTSRRGRRLSGIADDQPGGNGH
ncbi:hypothetical protein GCM10009555_077290 [Acrocarpospora macrocephala]|uniref:Uncharacterized protein n=1 Tax=Acrocarpospora macrocephala TaxID=150177 RepID=A0A5M3X2M9_9ACTN|nr:hypothetical protein [Acrocarpospora macrocephala]GES15997.1 hypothetical protein Amac_095950 [Acrocarpospora macrocephala]